MDFVLPEEIQMIQRSVREWAKRNLTESVIQEYEKKGEPPLHFVQDLVALGVWGLTIPQEYGGSGMGALAMAVVSEELNKAWAAFGLTWLVHNTIGSYALVKYGNGSQKEKWLPRMARGEALGSFALTEPDYGSDAANIQTSALPMPGDVWVVNGTKTWITNAWIGPGYEKMQRLAVVFIRTDPRVELHHRGISAFLIDLDRPFIRVERFKEEKMGQHASPSAEIHFDSVVVWNSDLVSEMNHGFYVAMDTLNNGRVGIAAQALGIAQAAFEDAFEYAKNRKTMGKPIVGHQLIQVKLADMAVKIENARNLVYKAALLQDQQDSRAVFFASMAKRYATDVAVEVCEEAVRVHGGYGYIYRVSRFLRDAMATPLYEGSNEIQAQIIVKELLKQ